MEKRENSHFVQNRRWPMKFMVVLVIVIICAVSTILPCSAFVYSPIDAGDYSMPLDFIFFVEQKTAGVTDYKLSGYLLSPLLDDGDSIGDYFTASIETEYEGPYSGYYRSYYQKGLSVTSSNLLAIYAFTVDEYQFYDYQDQRFVLTANDSVVALGQEFVHLQTPVDSDGYYNAYVAFDYKIAGDTTVHHYEKGHNTANNVQLIPTATQLGLDVGDLIYIYNYIAVVEYIGDPNGYGDGVWPELSVYAITTTQKHANSVSFMDNNDRLLSGTGEPPIIDNVWLLNSVASFFNFEIFPGFSLGGVMGILFAITVLIAVLKFVAGG